MLVDNSNISNDHLFGDGIHMVELGWCILANNVIDYWFINTLSPPKHTHTHDAVEGYKTRNWKERDKSADGLIEFV